jgi:hypothetical protein
VRQLQLGLGLPPFAPGDEDPGVMTAAKAKHLTFGRHQDIWIAHIGESMLAERRYIDRDFRKRDEEKFANASG